MCWIEQLQTIRSRNNISERRNIAITRGTIDGDVIDLYAVSGINDYNGVNLPKTCFFQLLDPPPGHYRGYDSEYKILETIAEAYQSKNNISGSIELFTERSPCPSCLFVINQFRLRFPNIKITIIHQ